jgi:hypothetical protein
MLILGRSCPVKLLQRSHRHANNGKVTPPLLFRCRGVAERNDFADYETDEQEHGTFINTPAAYTRF